jgi:hypothetical protein
LALILPKTTGRNTQTSRGPLRIPVTGKPGPLVLGAPVGQAPAGHQATISTQTSSTLPGASTSTTPGSPSTTPGPNLQEEARRINNQRIFDTTNNQINQDETTINQAYGWTDTSNPFSQAALLKQAYTNRQRGTTNSLAARGQLYSGAYANQQAIDTRQNDQAVDSSRRAFDQAIINIGRRRTAAQTALDTGNLDAADAAVNTGLADIPTAPATQDLTTGPVTTGGTPKTLSAAAAARRKKRKAAGVSDTRGLSAKAVKSLRTRGLLP